MHKPYELILDIKRLESALQNGWDICNLSIKWTRYMPDVVLADHDSIINAIRTIIPPVSEYDSRYKSPCWHPTYDLAPIKKKGIPPQRILDYTKKIGSEEVVRLLDDIERGQREEQLACLPAIFFGTIPKTASTTMYEMLTTHRSIVKANVKEPFWFNLYAPDLVEPSISQEVHRLRLYSYLALLNKPNVEALTIDGSTFTLFSHGPVKDFCVISHVTSTLIPNAKFIVTLRAPWHRLYSELWWNSKHANERRYLGRYIHNSEYFHRCATAQIMWFMRCLKHSSITSCVMEIESLVPLQYKWRTRESDRFCFNQLVRGMYYLHIQTWLKYFPRDNFLFVKYEDFKLSPYTIMNEIADFLGISHFEPDSLKEAIDHPKLVLKYPPMELQTLEVLKKFYMPFNKALANFLNDDRFLWEND